MDLAQGAFHEHHRRDNQNHHHQHAQDHRCRDHTRTTLAKELRQSPRNFCYNAGKDDQRDAVADATRSNLLAQPHQEHRPADQRDHTRDHKEHARRMRQTTRLDRLGNAKALEGCQDNRAVTGPLVHLFATLIALFLHLLQRWHHRGQQLNDDRGRNIGHDPQREDAHALNCAAGEHRQHAADALACVIHKVAQRGSVNTWNRHIGAQTIDHQQADGEKNTAPKIGCLA